MISLLIVRGKTEVKAAYYRNKEEDMEKEENCDITPFIHSSPRPDMPKPLIHHPQGY